MKLIYILGTGRSGSTLLDIILGGHPDIASLGEVMGVFTAIKANPPCSDGYNFNQSPFWKPVIDIAKSSSIYEYKYFNGDRFALIKKRFFSNLYRKELFYFKKINYSIFKKIQSNAKTDWLVDSSKVYWRLQYLLDSNIFNEIKVIFLIRNGKAVSISEWKKGRSYFRGVFKWWHHTYGALKVLRHLKKEQFIIIKYEELAINPEKTIKEICHFLNVKYHKEMLYAKNHNHYSFSGNVYARLEPLKNEKLKIKLRNEWENDFTIYKKLIFNIIALRLNKKLFY